jgi:hypothetical protein
VRPKDLRRVYRAAESYVKYGIEIGLRCDCCGRPVRESRREWRADGAPPVLEDEWPPPWCPECERIHRGVGSPV